MSSFKEGLEDWNLYVADRDRAEICRHKLFADHLRHLPEIIREALNNPKQRLYALEIAVPLLESGNEEEYRRILELYVRLDGSLALGLAKRAASHLDAEVRAVGREFLDQHRL